MLFERGGDPAAIVDEQGLAQVSDAGALEALVDQAIAENPKSVEDYRGGKKAALQFLVGQVMRLSQGKANPRAVNGAAAGQAGVVGPRRRRSLTRRFCATCVRPF